MEEKFELPPEHEAEKASNSYIMSLLAVVWGIPLPFVNLLTTLIFYLANRKSPWFVRWHCTQALLSQSSLLIINTVSIVWSFMLLFHKKTITDCYIAFIITAMIFNIWEFIATIDAALKTRKGIHVQWFFYGTLTNYILGKR
jgi:uncharacterized Tic20 family protein